jgi:serine O-acetyltransferase
MARDPTGERDLEAAIDAISRSYDGPEEINNLESTALPNKRAVIEAFTHLKWAIFIGFYSRRSLSKANLRFAISEHLYPAYEILVEQVKRAITYEQCRGAPMSVGSGWSEQVVLRLFHELPELRRVLNTDVVAAYHGDPAAASVEEIVFSYPSIDAITAHRIAKVLYDERVPMIPRIIAEHAHTETGIDIHPGAAIGTHFFVDHGTGVVIGETCVIGNHVKIYQGVTLGALSTERNTALAGKKRHPTIEDGVTIYADATILGGETVIGAGSIVGGNTWIMRSVPPGTKTFGRDRAD